MLKAMLRWLFLSVLAGLLHACVSQESLGVGSMGVLSQGVINDPENKTLRFDLLQFGLAEFCREMQRTGVPLKMRDGDPSMGRFFAISCQSQIIGEQGRHSIVVRYSGTGYAWTNVTSRVGFETQGLVEYSPDFQLNNGALYIYFRPRNVDSTSFHTTLVESSVAAAGIALTGAQPDAMGRDLVTGQLRRGFTVIRVGSEGVMDFGMGIVPVGHRPFRPFQITASDKRTLDNDRSEIHAGQQDFVAGLLVSEDNQALYITATLDGAPAVDLVLVPENQVRSLLLSYVRTAGPVSMASAPFGAVLQAGAPLKQYVPVPPGNYALVFDHSSGLGSVTPPAVALDERAARIDYLVQVGDRP
jgi:hypothetical protein